MGSVGQLDNRVFTVFYEIFERTDTPISLITRDSYNTSKHKRIKLTRR